MTIAKKNPPPRCEFCGYTGYDKQLHIDHAICEQKNGRVGRMLPEALTAQPVPQAAGWKEVRHAPADKDILLYCPHLNATNPERMEVGYYRTTAGGTMHSWATHWMELPPTPYAPLPSSPVLGDQAALGVDDRDAFEAWCRKYDPTVKLDSYMDDGYKYREAELLYECWKAALQNAASQGGENG